MTQQFQVQNNGPAAAGLQVTVQPRNAVAGATVSVDQSTLAIAPGESATLQVSLTGAVPPPGSYEGFVVLQGDAVTLRIPYLYLVGDGIPANLIPLLGDLAAWVS